MASKERRIEALRTLAAETKAALKIKTELFEKEEKAMKEKYGIKSIDEVDAILDALSYEIKELDEQILTALDDIEAKLEEIE